MNPKHTAPAGEHAAAALANDLARRVRQAIFDAALNSAAAHDPVAVPRGALPIAPARLARMHPGGPAAQAQAQLLYTNCLRHYREVVRRQDNESGLDDVGAAVACFVAANLQALHGVRTTPAMLLQLERQLGGVAQSSAAWATAPASERQCYFETMALLAVLIGESSVQAPSQGAAAVANVQRAARGYLQQLLGLDPQALTLDAQGLALREPALT